MRHMTRTPQTSIAVLIQATVMSLFVGSLFHGSLNDESIARKLFCFCWEMFFVLKKINNFFFSHIPTHTHTYTHTHTHIYIYTYTHTHTHIHTYKHTTAFVRIQNRMGALFFCLTNLAFGQMQALLQFVNGRSLFLKEKAAGLYRISAYYLSKTLADLPSLISFDFLHFFFFFFFFFFFSSFFLFLFFSSLFP